MQLGKRIGTLRQLNISSLSAPPVAAQNGRCQILAKKGFLTLRNITSGLAILVYSSEFQIGVLFQLPAFHGPQTSESITEEHAFVRSAMTMILAEFHSLGVRKKDLATYAVGGSASDGAVEASAAVVRRALWSSGLTLSASDLGGNQVRSVWMDVESGRIIIRSEPIVQISAAEAEPLSVAS